MEREYFLEFQRIGGIIRVVAMDSLTGTEVVLQGPASAGEQVLSVAAIKKLEYVLQKKNKNESD